MLPGASENKASAPIGINNSFNTLKANLKSILTEHEIQAKPYGDWGERGWGARKEACENTATARKL